MMKCFHTLLLLFVLMLQACPAYTQPISSNSIYVNEVVGVRTRFDSQWQVFTSRNQAPEQLKPDFPANKGPNGSPLLMAFHDNGLLHARLLLEVFSGDLESFAAYRENTLQEEGLEVLSTRISPEKSALEITFVDPTLALRYVERISLLESQQIIRMALWTSQSDYMDLRHEFDRVFNETQLRGVVNGPAGWQPVWSGLLGQPLAASGDSPAVAMAGQASVCAEPGASLLWQVADDDSEIYLFGSIHVGKADFYPLHERIESIFREAEYLVFEVDPETIATPGVLLEMQRRGMLPPGQTLNDVVSAEVVARLRQVLAGLGLPADNFMGMQPWFVTLMLTGLQMNMSGYQPQFGVENYFYGQKAPDTTILELENIQDQIGFLEDLNAEAFLEYTLQGFEEGSDDMGKLVDAWACADKEALASLLFDEFSEDPVAAADMEQLREKMFYQRNLEMAYRIEELAARGGGDYFIVVGSGHLLGERSIIEVLKSEGYEVTPVLLQ